MARHENNFAAAAEATLDPVEWLAALRIDSDDANQKRRAAIALCLSGREGWRSAATQAGGAFAGGKRETGLTGGKEK